MMDFALKMMDFALKMMDFALKMMDLYSGIVSGLATCHSLSLVPRSGFYTRIKPFFNRKPRFFA